MLVENSLKLALPSTTLCIRKFKFAPLSASQGSVEQWGGITIVFRLK